MRHFFAALAAALALPAHALTFVLLGQSNLTRAEQTIPLNADRIQVMRDASWEPYQAPTDYRHGIGPGAALADALAGSTDSVRVIQCAVPDTRIAQHRRSWSPSTIYGACLKRIRLAGHIDFAVWWQGENDAQSLPLARKWLGEFMAIVTGLRIDTGRSDLPVIVARLHYQPSIARFPGWSVIRQAQGNINVPGISAVSTDGVAYPDGVHAGDYSVIGQRMVEVAK